MAKKLSAFEQAFANARKAGKKEFEFNGKKYHTRLASEETESVGGIPKAGEYKTRAPYGNRGNEMTSKNYVPRDDYVRSGKKSFDTETEFIPPDMSAYKPRRPNVTDLSMTRKPGTNTNYENEDIDTYKKGGSVGSASRRGDGIAQRGKTKGRLI
jgi:hypothetical protein